jgi:hypothetical protein
MGGRTGTGAGLGASLVARGRTLNTARGDTWSRPTLFFFDRVPHFGSNTSHPLTLWCRSSASPVCNVFTTYSFPLPPLTAHSISRFLSLSSAPPSLSFLPPRLINYLIVPALLPLRRDMCVFGQFQHPVRLQCHSRHEYMRSVH